MNGLYIRILNREGRVNAFPLSSYRYEGQPEIQVKQGDHILQGDSYRHITCKNCGHYDFNSDGRFDHEYSCDGCGSYIEAYERS